ncbi:MAG: hypothetical protein HYV07_31835 [Deltaproteobacteria bacterium]|nr:hypothetical protein [Deltaproteobacteria bacterium]
MTTPPARFDPRSAIRRDARGRWYDGAAPIDHERIERAFARWVDVADDGRFILRNSVSWAYVEIEGPPIFAESARFEAGALVLALSDGTEEPLAPSTLRADPDGRLYCDVHAGRLTAGLSTAAATALGEVLVERVEGTVARIGGGDWLIETRSDALATGRRAPSLLGEEGLTR